MPSSTSFRLFLAAIVFIGIMLLLALVLSAAQFGLSLWQQLQTAPAWVVILITILTSLLLGFGLWLSWRIVRPARTGLDKTAAPLTEAAREVPVSPLQRVFDGGGPGGAHRCRRW